MFSFTMMPLAIMWSAVFFIDCQRETLFVSRHGGALTPIRDPNELRNIRPSTLNHIGQSDRASNLDGTAAVRWCRSDSGLNQDQEAERRNRQGARVGRVGREPTRSEALNAARRTNWPRKKEKQKKEKRNAKSYARTK